MASKNSEPTPKELRTAAGYAERGGDHSRAEEIRRQADRRERDDSAAQGGTDSSRWFG